MTRQEAHDTVAALARNGVCAWPVDEGDEWAVEVGE